MFIFNAILNLHIGQKSILIVILAYQVLFQQVFLFLAYWSELVWGNLNPKNQMISDFLLLVVKQFFALDLKYDIK